MENPGNWLLIFIVFTFYIFLQNILTKYSFPPALSSPSLNTKHYSLSVLLYNTWTNTCRSSVRPPRTGRQNKCFNVQDQVSLVRPDIENIYWASILSQDCRTVNVPQCSTIPSAPQVGWWCCCWWWWWWWWWWWYCWVSPLHRDNCVVQERQCSTRAQEKYQTVERQQCRPVID